MRAALILAAGEGTRMKSALPKVAHALLGVPMVRYVVRAAHEAGVEGVIVVTGHGAETVEALVPTETCVRQEEQLGTGHAVMCAREALESAGAAEGSLVVLSGDTPLIRPETIRSLIESREREGAAASVLVARMEDPSGYGRIVRAEDGSVIGIVEDKDLAPDRRGIDEVNTGTYCFDAGALLARLDRLNVENAQGEYYLTDMIGVLRAGGGRIAALTAESAEETMGVNTRVHLSEATRVMQRRVNERHMLGGVTMIAPDLVWISPEASIGRDVVIEPMTTVAGASVIEEGAHVGPDTRVVDSRVGPGARVDSSVVLSADIGEGASVGPMSYLRPGTELAEKAKAGTFVEIKNSQVGPGSKVPHLSYIGDASIGASVNVGAGSITCNYDGWEKHGTVVEDGSFVGSDTMFVAPVRIGKGAVVGAGSVITSDVPEDALAVARGSQETYMGWAARRRARHLAERDDDG